MHQHNRHTNIEINYEEDMGDLEHRRQIRRKLEERLENKRLQDELREELDDEYTDEFDWKMRK